MTVSWGEVDRAAKRAFDVWFGQPELAWAKRAWTILEQAGLTIYSNELERHQVLLRFLALGAIYSDFCDVAWEEYSWPLYSDWAEPLEFDPALLDQLCAKFPEWDSEEDVSEGLEKLVENERRDVVKALIAGFGGLTQLYAALWKSKNFDEDKPEDNGEDYDETFDAGPAQCAAYQWVEQGCYRYR